MTALLPGRAALRPRRPATRPAAAHRLAARRGLALVLALAALPVAGVLPGAQPAAALLPTPPVAVDEVYRVPAGRVLTVQGHGYGHGRGMSQWGAQGAATLGVPAATILDTYYPGTATGAESGRLAVILTNAGLEGRPPAPGDVGRYECDSAAAAAAVRCRLEVLPAPGLTVRAAGAQAELPAAVDGAPVTRWRVTNDTAGLHLEGLAGGTWRPHAVDGSDTAAGSITFGGAPPSVRYADGTVRTYRGTVAAVRRSDTRVARVNSVALEDYLRSVVPKESSPGWAPAALEAQAVAARSYAAHGRSVTPAGRPWHLCDSTWCQVYAGRSAARPGGTAVSQEHPRTDAAIAATEGQVRTYAGRVVRAEFGAANGGWSTPGSAPWLPARQDPWDGVVPNSGNTWTAQLPAAVLERRFGLARLDELVVRSRDGRGTWGGRVVAVELRGLDAAGAPRTVATTGDVVRATAALRSSWFRPLQPTAADLTPGVATAAGRLPLAVRTPTGSVEVRSWSPTTGLSAPQQLGGAAVGGPAVAARPDGSVLVFHRGRNDRLYVSTRSATGTWSAWRGLGGTLTSRPAVAVEGGTVHVLARGADGAVWSRTSRTPGTWSGWASRGGSLAAGTAPAATSPAPGRLDVVVHAADGTLQRRTRADGAWSAWTGLGAPAGARSAVDDPALATYAGRPQVVVRGTDGAVWTRPASGAGAWRSLGGTPVSSPGAGSAARDRLDVVAVGDDGRLQRVVRTPAGWSAWAPLT